MHEIDATPKVSVIIPCYNREKTLVSTLESALAQTLPGIEFIAVDDGSTDETPSILATYAGRIIILEHPGRVNRGQSAAINLGLRQSRGMCIAILDSDDLWTPEKIQTQFAFLEQNPDIGVVYANGHAIDENGKILYKLYTDQHQETSDPSRVLLDCYLSIPSNSLVRKKVFDVVGEFDEGLRSAQDHDMAIRLAEATKFGFMNELLWSYRRHPDTQSQRHARRRWELGFYVLNKARKRFPYPPRIVRKRTAVLHFRLGQCLRGERNYPKALWHLLSACILDPVRALRVLIGRERVTGPN